MNKQIEALKMAIEALEEGFGTLECEGMLPHRYQETTQACKEALAEAEKQEWQSLSDDEIDNIWNMNFEFGFRACARAIEQALKEKNLDSLSS